MEFNKYLYYYMCLIADTVYLMWIAYCMFNSKLIRNITIFSLIYIALTIGLVIGYFYLGDRYSESLGLSGENVAKWSRYDLISIFSGVGVFMAPIAVLLGFNAWKYQKHENSRIQTIEKIKYLLLKQQNITHDFRYGNYKISLIFNRNFKEFNSKYMGWHSEFDSLHKEIFNIIEGEGFYLSKEMLEKLLDFHKKALNLSGWMDVASAELKIDLSQYVEMKSLSEFRATEREVIRRNIYLIEPNYVFLLKEIFENNELSKKLSTYESDVFDSYFLDFFSYLNKLLETSYK